MKKLLLPLLAFCICLLSCYEVNEEILIRDNGSGHYSSKIDMSALLEMMQSFGSEEELGKQGLDKPIDTTLQFKSMLDSAKKLTPDERSLMETGLMHMIMNLKEKQFRIDMDFDFKNNRELALLLSGAGNGGFGDAMKSVLQKQPTPESQLDAPKDLEVDQLSNIYDVQVENGLISKKVNKEKLKAITEKPEMAQMSQMASSGMEILYTTTIVLPRPVKKIDNPALKLSADKKRITIRNNLMDVFSKPEGFEFRVEY